MKQTRPRNSNLLCVALFTLLSLTMVGCGENHSATGDGSDVEKFSKVDRNRQVPDRPLRQALNYLNQYSDRFPNQSYMIIVDFTQPSSSKRLYLLNLQTGAVETHLTAHGKGSDPSGTGMATSFSNDPGSKASSLGFYRTAEIYTGEHGRSLRLDGLSPTDDNARSREIVMHPASYVQEDNSAAGRSWGCFAMDANIASSVINRVKEGALLYAWNGQ